MNDFSKLRVAFLGNCQAAGVVPSLRALLPGASVNGWNVNNDPSVRREVAERVFGYDVIIAHEREGDELFDPSSLSERCTTLVYMKPIIFGGFHPDIAIVRYRGQLLSGPLDLYHSAIIAAAYSLGLDHARVCALFNSLSYAKLGYFNAFDGAKAVFLEEHLKAGYDLDAHFAAWLRHGPFMYLINHPRVDVLSTMATLAAARAGLVDNNTPAPTGITDDLAQGVRWPIYPEIAKRIGVAGGTKFHLDGSLAVAEETRACDLADLAARFYKFYSSLPDLVFDALSIVAARDYLLESLC